MAPSDRQEDVDDSRCNALSCTLCHRCREPSNTQPSKLKEGSPHQNFKPNIDANWNVLHKIQAVLAVQPQRQASTLRATSRARRNNVTFPPSGNAAFVPLGAGRSWRVGLYKFVFFPRRGRSMCTEHATSDQELGILTGLFDTGILDCFI